MGCSNDALHVLTDSLRCAGNGSGRGIARPGSLSVSPGTGSVPGAAGACASRPFVSAVAGRSATAGDSRRSTADAVCGGSTGCSVGSVSGGGLARASPPPAPSSIEAVSNTAKPGGIQASAPACVPALSPVGVP